MLKKRRSDIIDLTDKTFGKIKVLKYHSSDLSTTWWWVKCLGCNREYKVNGFYLRDGRTTQCFDCAAKERIEKRRIPDKATDGKFWRKWESLILRHKPNNMLDKRWYDYNQFRQDIYPFYMEGYRLDRIDRSKPYSIDNCYFIVPDSYHYKHGSTKIYFT
jgi:hypothetical protein